MPDYGESYPASPYRMLHGRTAFFARVHVDVPFDLPDCISAPIEVTEGTRLHTLTFNSCFPILNFRGETLSY